ncbi:hypothetical protein MN608_06429 [Microdochium nivale]|nr:hypothetical protein MN608_06429 [Microdochium nivale]
MNMNMNMNSYYLPLLKLFDKSPTATMDAMMGTLRQCIDHLPTHANIATTSATVLATTVNAASPLTSSSGLSTSIPVFLVMEVLVGVYFLAGIIAANFMLRSASRFDAVDVEVPGSVIAEVGALVLFWPVVLSVWVYQGRQLAELEVPPVIIATVAEMNRSSSKNEAVAERGDKKVVEAATVAAAPDIWDERQTRRDTAAAVAITATSPRSDSANHSNSKRTINGRRKQGFWARHVPSLARMRRHY